MNMNNNATNKSRRDTNHSNNSGKENVRSSREERNAWKQERAKEPDSLIIKASSERVVALINILPHTDYAMRRVQNRIGIDIDIKDAEKIFDEWNKIVLNIHEFTEKHSQLVNVRYIESAAIKRIKNTVTENKDDTLVPAPASSDKKVKGG